MYPNIWLQKAVKKKKSIKFVQKGLYGIWNTMGSSKSHSANLLGSSLGMCYGCMCGHVKFRQKNKFEFMPDL